MLFLKVILSVFIVCKLSWNKFRVFKFWLQFKLCSIVSVFIFIFLSITSSSPYIDNKASGSFVPIPILLFLAINNVLLLNPQNDEAIYMLILLKIKQYDYNEAKKLIDQFSLIYITAHR